MQQTPQQLAFCEAVANSTSSILLKAVAGSGKTTTMVAAIARLKPGSSVLACAFNSKIAKELSTRVPGWVDTATLNSIGHRAWQATINKKLAVSPRKMGTLTSDLCKANSCPDLWQPIRELATKAKASGLVPFRATAYDAIPILEDTFQA